MLPVFSVGTEKEARALLTICCPTNPGGEFIARELTHEQSLENLDAFSDLLAERHKMVVKSGRCECKGTLQVHVDKCYHCEKEVDEGCFCYGCKKHICEDCEDYESVQAHTIGPHDPMDHVTKFKEAAL